MENVIRFVDNKQFISPTEYERELGHIYSEFSEAQWVERFVTLFLMYEKFENEFFHEHAKSVLKNNRDFPVKRRDVDVMIEIIDKLIPLRERFPKLFKYAVPEHISSLYCLYVMEGTKDIFDEYLVKVLENYSKEDIVDSLISLDIFPDKLEGLLLFHDEENFEVNINNTNFNSLFYRFKLDTFDMKLNFLPEMIIHTRDERNIINNYNKSNNKEELYEPNIKKLKGQMIPVSVKLSAGDIWISADIKERNPVSIPLDFNVIEALEGAVTLDPLTVFKMINRDDNFKDAEEIINIILNKKNKTLSNILTEYYIDKYKENTHVSVDGYAIYKSFVDSAESIIETKELERFNNLIQLENLNADKAKFIIFYERMKGEIPLIAKPIIEVRKIAEKIKNKIFDDE